MCTVCGCGEGEARVEGQSVHGHEHAHAHEHRHADGTVHSHAHDHAHGHGHGSGHEHEHEQHAHAHEHHHADGTVHSHAHDHAGAEHDHVHGHQPVHADGTVHSHSHSHSHVRAHVHAHAHAHTAGQGHEHSHEQNLHFGKGPAHAHAPGLSQERMVRIEQDILGKNNAYAAENRRVFAELGTLALNLVSSPGSGKTTLLTATIERLQGRLAVSVIEGDQQTSHDAERIRATGAPAVQVNTGKGCHLDAHMVGKALQHLPLSSGGLLLIENVGNLVCPSAFDLGEAHKVVILSVTEGEDKPIKYPDMFHAADLMIINKIDLLPYVDFSVERCIEFARQVNPALAVLQVSARSGAGMDAWIAWLEAARQGQTPTDAAANAEVAALRQRVAELEAQLQAAQSKS